MNNKTKRLIIGAVSLMLSLVIAFVIAPFFLKMSEEKVKVLRMKADASAGSVITASMLETASILRSSLRGGELSDSSSALGMVLRLPRRKGDFITQDMIQSQSLEGAEYLLELSEDEIAFSISIRTLAAGLSDHLKAGDIVSVYAQNDQKEKVIHDPLLWYVRVLAVHDKSGQEVGGETKPGDDTYQSASVTLSVSMEQAERLTELEYETQIHLALVERADNARKEALLEEQTKYLKKYRLEVEKEKKMSGETEKLKQEETP